MKFTPKTIIITVLCLLPFLALAGWFINEAKRPLPGQAINYDCGNFLDFSKVQNLTAGADKCRVHISIGAEVKSSTNPPVFGPHYPDWIRAGVFDSPKDDRNLVHSEEHGYIILSYNCDFGKDNGQQAGISGSIELATDSAHLSDNFKSDECKSLVAGLTKIYDDEGHTKIIVIPRPNLDARLAVTTWARIDKWNPSVPLSQADIARIKNFIEVLRDHGPEKTME